MAPSTATVLIGCKLPNGVILELITEPPSDRKEQGLQPAPPGPRVVIAGSNSLRLDRRAAQGVHVYATTRIDKSFWDQWIARPGNKEMAFIKNGQVFVAASGSERDLAAEAKEKQGSVVTGMEALAHKDDPRLPKSTNPNTAVEADPVSLKPRDPDARPVA
jgi:hypothetical protein